MTDSNSPANTLSQETNKKETIQHEPSIHETSNQITETPLVGKYATLEIGEILPKVEKIETALEPKFQEYFIEAMALPHKTDPYEELAKVVKLPSPKAKAEGDGQNDRKRGARGRRLGPNSRFQQSRSGQPVARRRQ